MSFELSAPAHGRVDVSWTWSNPCGRGPATIIFHSQPASRARGCASGRSLHWHGFGPGVPPPGLGRGLRRLSGFCWGTSFSVSVIWPLRSGVSAPFALLGRGRGRGEGVGGCTGIAAGAPRAALLVALPAIPSKIALFLLLLSCFMRVFALPKCVPNHIRQPLSTGEVPTLSPDAHKDTPCTNS